MIWGSKLPQNHGPWTVTGVVGPDMSPPHNFSRDAIEEAIDVEGFQRWRLSKVAESFNEGQTIEYEIVSNPGKQSAENIKVR